jgi:DNA topoisomerase-1
LAKSLVIVESPAKAKTIGKFLGRNYVVKASIGHVRDLPKSQFGVDIDSSFTPKYITIRGKGDIVKELRDAAKKVDKIFLAADPDREGEAIAWELAELLGVKGGNCRIEFHEITKKAIQSAVKTPRPIDLPRVDAYQARRVLDRIVGYKLSPLLWAKVKNGLSAGRVQSPAVRLICEREDEIKKFVPEEYWSIEALLKKKEPSQSFQAKIVEGPSGKLEMGSKTVVDAVLADIGSARFTVKSVKKRERKRNPSPPFTTSSLQQEASQSLVSQFGER